MKRFLNFLLLFLFLAENSSSQSCVDSSSRFLLQSGTARINVRDNLVLADSSVIIAGNIREPSQSVSHFFISRLDKHNNILYSKRLDGFNGSVHQVIACSNGDILVAAMTYPTPLFQTPWLLRFTSAGNLLWQKNIEPAAVERLNGSGLLTVYESSNGHIYMGMTCTRETDVDEGILSGYYWIYKLTSSGAPVWRTTLVDIENSINYINATRAENGYVEFISQQYAYNSCTATDSKSISRFRLNDNTGGFIDSRSWCLNFYGIGCIATWSGNRQTVSFTPDGRVIISGHGVACSEHSLFILELDNNFSVLQAHRYSYIVPYTISYGSVFINQYEQVSLLNRGYNGNNFLYSTFNPDGSIARQRKLQLPDGSASIGIAGFAFRKPDQFLVFTNQVENGNEWLQVMEFNGNNNGTADCSGKDTAFIAGSPHTLVPISFTWDTVRTEPFTTTDISFPSVDFNFQRTEICSSISICDSLKITGIDSICLEDPEQIFSAVRNPQCNKVPEWRIDPSVIDYMHPVNDTTVRVKFKQAWEGYIYAYSNSCTNLLDSFYIKVFPSAAAVHLGRDTSYCNPLVLDAGANFTGYQWQDNSTSRFYTVNSPGLYYVRTTDYCGNIYIDSIAFSPKKTIVPLGADTCISSYPWTINAGAGFKDYQWGDGSRSQQFSIPAPGLYYVTARNFCDEIYTDSIRIYKKMQPFSLGADSLICPGNTIRLSAPMGYPHYLWQDGSTGNFFDAAKAGKYYVELADFCGNKFTDTINLVQPDKKISLGPDVSICKKEKIQLSAQDGFSSYSWTPVYNISNSMSRSVIVNPEQTTTYSVIAETAGGCIAKDTIIVLVKDCPQHFYIPTAFTPNNDGKNDLFKPAFSAPVEQYELSIYNRWGQRIFYTTDKTKGWNGKLEGLDQDTGSFIWMCTYKFYGEPAVFKKGTFMLLR